MSNDKKDNRINDILSHLASAAYAAADTVTDAMQSTGQVVGEKYDIVKLNIELSRLQDEQTKLFANIGRTMYMIKSGAFPSTEETKDAETMDAQQTIDKFLIAADQKQQAIDDVSKRLKKLSGVKVCAVCGKVADAKDVYCSACGAELPCDE